MFIAIRQSSGFVIASPKYRSIVFHIVWDSPPSPETTIVVVVCNLLCPAVNDNGNVKPPIA